ncbi:rhomboid family intramembrane serine protease [Microbulbifer rhizosphaerae]|uniref:Membrane associated rhomboid family serine protease n=1 Tax=Microbulbifer rhizosphaerae TaxID=1562603 RepID=A0A7W4WDC6_9GAMM|nr:membrane associated rhomboid family serine protease [Microbulbifer rhizosphaerae]
MSEFLSSATGALLVATSTFSLIALYLLPGLLARCAFQPYRVWRGEQLGSLVLAGFVHANLLHLAVNMWCLWVFGPPLERQIGTPAFALLYGLALVGLVFVAVFDPGVWKRLQL